MGSILESEKNLGLKCWHKIENQILQCISSQRTPLYIIGIALQTKLMLSKHCLQILLNISKEDHTINEHDLKLTNTQTLMKKVTNQFSEPLHTNNQRWFHSKILPVCSSTSKTKEMTKEHICSTHHQRKQQWCLDRTEMSTWCCKWPSCMACHKMPPVSLQLDEMKSTKRERDTLNRHSRMENFRSYTKKQYNCSGPQELKCQSYWVRLVV